MKTAEQIFREWSQDMPAQFWNKHNIDVILQSYSRQFAELYEVCEQLKNRLDIDSSSGVLLDGIGDILTMTRKGAYEILKTDKMDDDKYRKVLHYQALKESSDATYEDIMKSMRLLWNPEGIHYEEPRDLPATIHIRMDQVSLDDMDPAIGAPITIKPAGVRLTYLFSYYAAFKRVVERIEVPRIKFHIREKFFEVRSLDGSHNLDGQYNLDAQRRYRMAVAVLNRLGKIYTAINTKAHRVRFLASVKVSESISDRSNMSHIRIPLYFWFANLLDGLNKQDGTVKLDAVRRHNYRVGITNRSTVYNDKPNIGGGLITFSRDYRLLDGKLMLNGSRNLDSIYKHETL